MATDAAVIVGSKCPAEWPDDGEQCDDGNDISGDGCDSGCSLEETDVINGAIQIGGAIGAGGQDRFNFVADGLSRLLFRPVMVWANARRS